ncbi:MAG: hypothetical protein N2Z80_05945 [Hydrogenothermaceae bacterium]|nr:hypothetical protein [Hydrogenothermaceae bacterium]
MLKLVLAFILFLIAYKLFTLVASVFFRILNLVIFALLFYLLFIKYPDFTKNLLKHLGF